MVGSTSKVTFGKYTGQDLTYEGLLKKDLAYVQDHFGKYKIHQIGDKNNVMAMGVVQTQEFVATTSDSSVSSSVAAQKFLTWLKSDEGKSVFLKAQEANRKKTPLDNYNANFDDAVACCSVL